MTAPSESPILIGAARAMAPVIQLIGLYVVFHGHYSPGGGFQGGVLLAAGFVLVRLALGSAHAQHQFPTHAGVVLGVVGLAGFLGVGFASLLAGGNFLEHGQLPLPGLDPASLRSLAILLVEAGVALAVPAVLVAIYDTLVESPVDA